MLHGREDRHAHTDILISVEIYFCPPLTWSGGRNRTGGKPACSNRQGRSPTARPTHWEMPCADKKIRQFAGMRWRLSVRCYTPGFHTRIAVVLSDYVSIDCLYVRFKTGMYGQKSTYC